MLLSSPRHTYRDLAYWASLARRDEVCAELLVRKRKPERAIQRIQKFTEKPCYIATSWGKDSVVTCHLVAMAGVDVPFVHIVQEGPQKDPEQHRVRDAFLDRFPVDYHEIVVSHELGREHRDDGSHFPALDIGIREARRRWGKRYIGGLRAAESGLRKRAIRSTYREDPNSCWPIGEWSGQDVFSWLALHDLPIHPAYACTNGGLYDRERIRIGIIGGPKGTEFGRRQWEWLYYPEVMRNLAKLGIIPGR